MLEVRVLRVARLRAHGSVKPFERRLRRKSLPRAGIGLVVQGISARLSFISEWSANECPNSGITAAQLMKRCRFYFEEEEDT